MIRCIILHQGYPFAEPQWREGPWTNSTKDNEQLLYDHGFSLAYLLHKLDALAAAAQDQSRARDPTLLIDVMKSIVALNDDLNRYRNEHLSDSKLLSLAESEPPPSDWTEVSTILDQISFHLEGLVLTWWAIKLFLLGASNQLALKTQPLVHHLPSVAVMHRQILDFSGDGIRNRLGLCILQAIPLIVQDSMGQFETSRTIFPLTAATFQFRHSGAELETCRRLKSQIASRKGFKFARGIE